MDINGVAISIMKRTVSSYCLSVTLAVYFLFTNSANSIAFESTLPQAKYPDNVSASMAEKYRYVEDGDFSKSLDIPVYEWLPRSGPPKVVILAVHGLTLHGRRFRVLARTLAANGFGFISLDMRGFGACFVSGERRVSPADTDKSKVNHEESYREIVRLARLIRKKYGDVKIVAAGECLGCTFCTRLAGEHPDLIDGMILSGPSVRVNPAMYVNFGAVVSGLSALLTPSHELTLAKIIARSVSNNPDVVNEDLADPCIRKRLPLRAVLSSYAFVNKTGKYGKLIGGHLPVLIFQSRDDGCVSSKRVIDLVHNMGTDNETMEWRVTGGHLQLETSFLRPEVLEAVIDWLGKFADDSQVRRDCLRQDIVDAGGIPVDRTRD